MWHIDYYTDPNGRQPIVEWLDRLDKKTRNHLLDKVVRLQQYGLMLLDTSMLRTIKGYGNDFYEIKYSNFRIALYHEIITNSFVLLHGFKKERMKEIQDIKTAYARLLEYQSRE